MNWLSRNDMTEATRLTRAGRLKEAMDVLMGSRPSAPDPGTPPGAPGSPPTVDLQPDDRGTWIFPQPERARTDEAPPPRPALAGGLGGMLDRLGLGRLRDHADGLLHPAPPRPAPVREDARFQASSFTNPAGTRPYKLYIPSTYVGTAMPLVVMLHGCTQSPDDFAAGTRMNALAETHGFLVAYPGQTHGANASKCWNWFSEDDQHRDRGEPSLIAGITRQIMADRAVDPGRVFIAGLSAGGAAAAVMGTAYPDLYAAIGVHSGLACGAAKDMLSGLSAMRKGSRAPIASSRPVPTIVFHGDKDATVAPINGDQVIAQAQAGMSLQTMITEGQSPAGMRYTRRIQSDARGRVVLEQWILHGAGHAWSGGSPEGSYTDPKGPDASQAMIRFFLQFP